jgi:WD40 repeat protein
VAVSPGGAFIAVAGGRRDVARQRFSEPYGPDADIRVWSVDRLVADPRTRPTITANDQGGAVNVLAFRPGGGILAGGSSDATVRLWDTTGLPSLRAVGDPLTGHTGAVDAIAFSRDKRTLATTGTDQTVRLWDVASFPDGRPTTGDVLSPPGPEAAQKGAQG